MNQRTYGSKKNDSKSGVRPPSSPKTAIQPIFSPQDPLVQIQRQLGNAAVQRMYEAGALQAKLKIGEPDDMYEQEADRVAEQVMRMPEDSAASIQRSAISKGKESTIQLKPGGPFAKCSQDGDEEAVRARPIAERITPLAQRPKERKPVQMKKLSAAPAELPDLGSRLHNLQEGEPLPASTRAFFEPRFGADFGHVRVHTSGDAAETAQQINAQAFTRGRDIVFGPGRYRPQTPDGQRLLAHELVHTMQQGSGSLLQGIDGCRHVRHADTHIQRDEPETPAPMTARTILPFPRESRVVLSRILSDQWFDMISAFAPEVAAAFGAIDNQVATVTAANDDLFEATITPETPVNFPGGGGRPPATINTITIRLQRQQDGTFNFDISGQAVGQTDPVTLFANNGLTATREGESIVLSRGSGSNAIPQMRVTPGSSPGQLSLGVYTAPYLAQLPEWARGMAPERLEALQVTQLPEVRPGTSEERQAIESIAGQTRSQRSERRQRLMAGGGIISGAELDPLLTASWQINFTPIPEAGGLFQIPLEVQLQYAPPTSLIGAISSGVEISLSQLEIPVNIRLVRLGLGGGALGGPEGGEAIPVFGPTLGTGVGLELGAFRMDLGYEHLFNLFPDSPGIDAGFLRLGGAY